MSEEKKTSIEELLSDIEAIVSRMEDKDIPLEESFSLYEEGTRKLKEANSLLDDVSKKVELLDEQGGPDGSLELAAE